MHFTAGQAMNERQHGIIKISQHENIIIATVIGSFNDVGARAYIDKIKSVVFSMQGKKYAILADCTDFEGGTPEVYQMLEDYNQWQNQTNLVAKAIVLKTSIIEEFLRAWSPAFELQMVKSFEAQIPAIKWLQTQLASEQ